jgi:hypothetical protein
MRRHIIIIPEADFAFAGDSFNLAIEHTTDGERLTREQEQQRRDRELADEAQVALPLEVKA